MEDIETQLVYDKRDPPLPPKTMYNYYTIGQAMAEQLVSRPGCVKLWLCHKVEGFVCVFSYREAVEPRLYVHRQLRGC